MINRSNALPAQVEALQCAVFPHADVAMHPVTTVARQAGELGIPTLATCLATPSPSAPITPGLEATVQLAAAAAVCLQAGGAWPTPANFPRAHFPFPTAGRWSLGRGVPAPRDLASASAGLGNSNSEFAAADCWALGEEGAWMGDWSGGQGEPLEESQALALLRQAFCEGDVLLTLNVPPSWAPQRGFAAARLGVIWHCYQVAAERSRGGGATDGVTPSTSGASWQADNSDLFGRSLPGQSMGGGTQAGAFVSQDNTAALLERRRGRDGPKSAAGPTWHAEASRSRQTLPSSFTLRPGAMLNDAATKGDVEAVFGGRASVLTLPVWPHSHPFSLSDRLLAHALLEGPGGLPAWLVNGQ